MFSVEIFSSIGFIELYIPVRGRKYQVLVLFVVDVD